MTPNAEYQQSIEKRIAVLENQISDSIDRIGDDSPLYPQQQRDLGYLHCLRDILSYGEPAKIVLDNISATLINMESTDDETDEENSD